jgi:hypothetical protein
MKKLKATDDNLGNVADTALPTGERRCVRAGLVVTWVGGGRAFQVGDTVVLDDDATQELTWRAAIGHHLDDYFTVLAEGTGA